LVKLVGIAVQEYRRLSTPVIKGKALSYFRNFNITAALLAFAFIGSSCEVNGQPIFNEGFIEAISGDPEATELTLAVRDALNRNGQTVNQRITVSLLSEDSVKLSGTVPDTATFHEAERVAYGVEGVRIVTNGLNVR